MDYFLFDKRNPTRYAIAYMAVTTEQRLDLIRDLEEKKPKYLVYSTNTWRIDGIPEQIQIPEVLAYLDQNYHVLQMFAAVVIAERNGS